MEQSQRSYWRFYWPLAFLGAVVVAGRLGQNRVLLGCEEGKRELAQFTLALAVFGPFRAALIFVPQMSNVLVRGPKSFRASARFLFTLCLVFTLPVTLLGWTSLGDWFLSRIYDVSVDRIAGIRTYMRYFTPLIVMGGMTGLLTGLLIQAMRTGMVTSLRIAHMAMLLGLLGLGVWLGWPPVITLSVSFLLSGVGHLGLAAALFVKYGKPRERREDRRLTQREIASFFLPMVATTTLFATSRPIIFAVLTSLNPEGDPALPDVDAMVSAVGLAFTFNMVFQAAINQFRNVLVTFGKRDPAGVRRFIWRVAFGITAMMILAAATPLAVLFLRDIQNAHGEILNMARQAVWPMCLAPLVVTWRNYYHGLTMVHRRTGGMLAGGVARNVAVLIFAPLLAAAGVYNHVTAAAMLVLAFAAEAFGMLLFTRRWRRGLSRPPAADDSAVA